MSIALLNNSHGTQPDVTLDDLIPEGIVSMDLAGEAGTLAVATRSGHMRLLSQSGEILETDRNFQGIELLVWAAAGNYGAAVLDENQLVCFDRNLKQIWQVKITGRITALAIAPHGGHVAFSTDGSRTHIVSIDRKEVCAIDTHRPMDYLAFLAEQPTLIAAAEFGNLCAFQLDGRELWHENIMNNIGDISVSGCGKRILLSAFNHGVQLYNSSGKAKGAFMVDGIPSRVSGAQFRTRLATITLENRLYWLNFEGSVLWVADLSGDPPLLIRTGPLGDRLFVATASGRLLQLQWA